MLRVTPAHALQACTGGSAYHPATGTCVHASDQDAPCGHALCPTHGNQGLSLARARHKHPISEGRDWAPGSVQSATAMSMPWCATWRPVLCLQQCSGRCWPAVAGVFGSHGTVQGPTVPLATSPPVVCHLHAILSEMQAAWRCAALGAPVHTRGAPPPACPYADSVTASSGLRRNQVTLTYPQDRLA